MKFCGLLCLKPSSSPQSSRYINGHFITDSDIPASNGIIHVLQAPLKAPPPSQQVSFYLF